MKVITSFELDFGASYRRRSALCLSIINPFLKQRGRGGEYAAPKIFVLKSNHRQIMSQSDRTSRGAAEEDKGG